MNSLDFRTEPEPGLRGVAGNFQICGIITPETQSQAGIGSLQHSPHGRSRVRLFFGEQSDGATLEIVREALQWPFSPRREVEIQVSGFYRSYRNSPDEMDYSALFVERLEVLTPSWDASPSSTERPTD